MSLGLRACGSPITGHRTRAAAGRILQGVVTAQLVEGMCCSHSLRGNRSTLRSCRCQCASLLLQRSDLLVLLPVVGGELLRVGAHSHPLRVLGFQSAHGNAGSHLHVAIALPERQNVDGGRQRRDKRIAASRERALRSWWRR
jgi:hypothetical protein